MQYGDLFPLPSIAWYRISVFPTLNNDPEVCPIVCLTLTISELSLAFGFSQFTITGWLLRLANVKI